MYGFTFILEHFADKGWGVAFYCLEGNYLPFVLREPVEHPAIDLGIGFFKAAHD